MLSLIPQSMIDSHAARLNARIADFAEKISVEVESVVEGLQADAVDSISSVKGVMSRDFESASALSALEGAFNSRLNKSDYDSIVLGLIGDFHKQVEEFNNFYKVMSKARSLPAMRLSEKDKEALTDQAASAAAALYSQQSVVTVDLRRLLGRSTNGANMSSLLKGLASVVRKLNRVKPIAQDHLILWFRLVGSLVYDSLSEKTPHLMYNYVGRSEDSTRDFCKACLDKHFYRKEIDLMDNDQVPGVFHNGGGHGCLHWWSIA